MESDTTPFSKKSFFEVTLVHPDGSGAGPPGRLATRRGGVEKC